MWRPFVSTFVSGPVLTARISQQCLAVETLYAQTVHRRWNSGVKMTKQLKKLFDRGSGSKKKKIFPGPVNLAVNSSRNADLKARRKPVYTEGQKRRAHQVSKVLYDNIVHLVNSGELSDRLASLSVDIVRVKVAPDFSMVNVYWLSSGTEEDATVQALLNENAGQLRHLLTSLHLLGNIPRISFVRDDSQAHYMEVETLLRTADFGPDFVPTRLDSTIRDMAWGRQEESSSPHNELQAHFNTLNIVRTADPVQETSEKPDVKRADEKGKPDSSDNRKSYTSRNTDDATTPLREESEHSALRTSPGQPSSLEVEQLGSQYMSTGQDNTDTMQIPSASSLLEEKVASLNKAFRDDMYQVPHSELLKKVLDKKQQKPGVRPSTWDGLDMSETIVPEMKSTILKSVLQKKVKSKSPKSRSDYFESDYVEVNSEDVYTDEEDYDQLDEDVDDDDFSTTDDLPRRK